MNLDAYYGSGILESRGCATVPPLPRFSRCPVYDGVHPSDAGILVGVKQAVIYYVEDDDNIRGLTLYALHQQGIEAEGFSCDSEFKAAVARRVPDAVLLDIMLPDTDGLEILRRLRADQETATVPIMMLTAKDTELDKVVALDGGADDYLTKPFSLMELTSRCRALLRRGGMTKKTSDILSYGGIVLSPSHREVTVDGKPVKLTLREFDLLEYLMRKPGVVFSREALLQSVWGWDFDGGSRTVDVHVQTLRQKLGDRSGCIETVRGVGYRFADRAAESHE